MMQPTGSLKGCTAPRDESRAVVFFPHSDGDGDLSASLIRASEFLETYSPYQRTDLEEIRVHDAGSIDVPAGESWSSIDAVEAYVRGICSEGRLSVMIARHHSLAFGAIRAAAAQWPDMRVIQFGAHAELKRDDGTNAPSDRTMMRRVWELLGDRRIFQFGVRSGSKEEFEWGRPPRVRMERFSTNSIDSCIESVSHCPVYITLDMSVIDPGLYPASRFPNAGGTTFSKLHDTLMSIDGLWVVGFDICGLCPELDDERSSSAAMTYKLLREMLIAFA